MGDFGLRRCTGLGRNLYLKTFAELGVVGLLFLILALGAPLVAAARTRASGIGVVAGAYTAYLIGAASDRHWELVAVTLAATFVGVAVLVVVGDA